MSPALLRSTPIHGSYLAAWRRAAPKKHAQNHQPVEGTFECSETVPSTFDLTWVRNGFGSLFTKATVIQTLGPVTTKLKGDFLSVTANVNGTWDGHDAVDQTGNIVDTQNRTITREVTMEANP